MERRGPFVSGRSGHLVGPAGVLHQSRLCMRHSGAATRPEVLLNEPSSLVRHLLSRNPGNDLVGLGVPANHAIQQ